MSNEEAEARERERCAQLCENMVAHEPHWNPDRKLTIGEALSIASDRIRAGDYGPIDMTGWRPPS